MKTKLALVGIVFAILSNGLYAHIVPPPLRQFVTDKSNTHWMYLKSPMPTELFWPLLFSSYKLDSLATEFTTIRSEFDDLGWKHIRFQQYHNHIKVDGAHYILHLKNDRVLKANGSIILDLPKKYNKVITDKEACQIAREHIPAISYEWNPGVNNDTLPHYEEQCENA